jgi:hypothetical protein
MPSNSSGTEFGSRLVSLFLLRGDFDIQVDFSLLQWPYYNGVRTAIGLTHSPSDDYGVERSSLSASEPLGAQEVYVADFGPFVLVPTQDFTGKLRLVRSGDTQTGYYYNAGEWIPILTDIAIQLHAWSHDYAFQHHDVRAAFDNFTVMTGQVVWNDFFISLDMKPGTCPNSFNRNSNGVLPAALPGSASFDVSQVDLTTVQLSRADGVGGSVAPQEGPPGPHTVIEDVATPFDGDLCDCHDETGDGFADLSMKFLTELVTSELLLDDLPAGALVELTLTGTTLDGTEFHANDCIRLVPPGTPTSSSTAAASRSSAAHTRRARK